MGKYLYTVTTAINGQPESMIGVWRTEDEAAEWMEANAEALAALERALVEEHVEGGSGDPSEAEAHTFVGLIDTPQGLGWTA